MKKFTLFVAALVAGVFPVMSQTADESAVIDSVAAVDGSNYVLVADPAVLVSPALAADADSTAVAEEPAVAANDSVALVADSVALASDSVMLAADSVTLASDSVMLAADSTQLDADSTMLVEQYVGDDDDAIKLEYVPNKFADNWELSLAGGLSVLFNGMGHVEETMSAPVSASGDRQFFDALGGIGEIAATKWLNPNIGARIGWTTGYLPFRWAKDNMSTHPLGAWHNYIHVDVLLDMTSLCRGVDSKRIYDAVPYVHMGCVVNPVCDAGVGGGVGYLSRFHVADHWLINLDVRGMATTARKFGCVSGIALDLEVLVGVSYRFDHVGWKKTVENPYKATLEELRAANEELDQKRAQVEEQNELMADTIVQREQERKELAKLVKVITKDTAFYGVPDTMEMSVYYAINSSELSMHEKAHMDIYLRLISLNDPNYMHIYKVIGTADAGTGDRAVNERLCQRRAETIKNVLIENGVDPENITTDIEIVESGDAQMARASHVIIYPVEKPKIVIPDTLNLDTDDEEDENASK